MTDQPKIRVFLLDDHEVVRRGVRDLLETQDDITVVGEAGSAAEARNRIAASRPNVAVLDVRLDDGTGIEVCRELGIGKLLYTSTPSVVHAGRKPVAGGNERDTPYGSRFTAHYPHSKMLAERAVLAANDVSLATLALRPRLIWGPGDTQLLPRLVERARAGRLRLIGDGGNRMDCTYIDNVVQAHLLALAELKPGAACAGKAYFISNGEPRPVRDIINGLLAAADAPLVEKSLPFPLAYALGMGCEALWAIGRLGGEPPMTRFLAEQLSTEHWYDCSQAQRDFGYTPEISMDEGLRRLRAALHEG